MGILFGKNLLKMMNLIVSLSAILNFIDFEKSYWCSLLIHKRGVSVPIFNCKLVVIINSQSLPILWLLSLYCGP
jgi:hypothetical protein